MGNLGYGAYPTHPGEVLKDEIEERGISQRQLAESMGLTYLLFLIPKNSISSIQNSLVPGPLKREKCVT